MPNLQTGEWFIALPQCGEKMLVIFEISNLIWLCGEK